MSLYIRRITNDSKELIRDTVTLYWDLLKVIVPVMLGVEIALRAGLVDILGDIMTPVMQFVGLPGEMSLVWVMSMLVGVYGAAVALVTILPDVPLTMAESSVLGIMILVAHGLPVEQKIIARAGPAFWVTTLLRIVGAIIMGWITWQIYAATDSLQQPAEILFFPTDKGDGSWASWFIDSFRSLFSIFFILLALLIVLKIFDITGLTRLLGKLLSPLLRLLGIGKEATSITLSGMLLGVTYGGALILKDVRKGEISRRDVFLASAFLCLCHSIIEDTLFMLALGTHWSASLLIRPALSIVIIILLARLVDRLPTQVFDRWICGPVR